MRSFLYKLTTKSLLASRIIWGAVGLRNRMIPLKTRLKKRFKRTLGYELDLDNPKTFNEKIQWLKVYDRSPLHTVCSDKYAVREHIKRKIGEAYLVPLVFQTTDVNDLKPENMPDYPVIIKTNHDSGGGTFVFNKEKLDWAAIRANFRKRLSVNYDYGKGEWQYKGIPPCIIVEELLRDEEGNIPFDFKMHYFNGKLAFTQVDLDRATDHKRNLYDAEWNFMNCKWIYETGRDVPKPPVYEEMVRIGEVLAKDFVYVRVDLYLIGHKIYFGELTFHSDSGNGKFIPEEWDLKIGNLLELPN
jgi:hypothetical protein